MGPSHHGDWGITRRGFLLGAAAGLAAGGPAAWFAARALYGRPGGPGPFTGKPAVVEKPEFGMPGRYPGRVIEVLHPGAVSPDHVIDAKVVEKMIDRGMGELTGTDPRDVKAAWGTFFDRDDIVGIKVNPVGRKPLATDTGRVANAVGSISSFEVLVTVARRLMTLGIPPQHIIVFERYADEFCDAGYADLLKTELPGVRWLASSAGYTNEQLDIRGFDPGARKLSVEQEAHVAGYDPDVFTTMGYCWDRLSRRDDRRFRSHLSAIVTRLVSKIINLPVLKDHRSAGVTLALKNLSHGMNNNVARSHLGKFVVHEGAGGVDGPNQCNTFIPQAASQRPLRQKATLHILDGLIGVYEGGPGCWNQTWSTWRHNGLLFATDPVALDHVGWDLIDARRARNGWLPVGRMGLVNQTPAAGAGAAAAPLADAHPLGAASLTLAARMIQAGRASESFNLRQPDHVILAGQCGLGHFDRAEIDHRPVVLQ